MLNPAIINSFVDELGLIKKALSLAQLGSATGAIGKKIGPSGVQKVMKAAPVGKARTTLRGQNIPGVAGMRRDYAAVQNANEQLQGARSLL